MAENGEQLLTQLNTTNRYRQVLRQIIACLSFVVVWAVFWSLKLTGIGIAGEAFCGMEEHSHDDSCLQTTLICTLEEAEPHIHGESCLYSELICQTEEGELHTHEASYWLIGPGFGCGQTEADGHTHTTECVTEETRLACGQEAGEFLFPNRPFTVLHNGKDFTKFCYNPDVRSRKRESLQLGDKIALGFVGNLNDQKNPFFLVDILADLMSKRFNTQLVLIGDGHLQDAVKQYATEKNVIDYITFTGRVSNVHEYIQALDIMLLPSLYEGLPNVVLEWQIAGLPSLVSDKVTRECKVTDLVSFLPIDQGAAVWADQIMAEDLSEDREVLSKGACELMKQAGFEIGASCKELERIYSNL